MGKDRGGFPIKPVQKLQRFATIITGNPRPFASVAFDLPLIKVVFGSAPTKSPP